MILEYCCKGVLKEFLVAVRENVTVEVEERLFRIVFGICQGMNYLASVKVTFFRFKIGFDSKIGAEELSMDKMAVQCIKCHLFIFCLMYENVKM